MLEVGRLGSKGGLLGLGFRRRVRGTLLSKTLAIISSNKEMFCETHWTSSSCMPRVSVPLSLTVISQTMSQPAQILLPLNRRI